MRLLAALILSALLLQGCNWFRNWGDPEPGDPAPLVDFDETVKVRKAWSTGVGKGTGKAGLQLAPV